MIKLPLNRQAEYILTGLAAGAFAVIFSAYTIFSHVQNRLESMYSDSARRLVKFIAAEAADLYNLYPDTQQTILSKKFDKFFYNNDDIDYIEYKDTNGNIIYSSKKIININETAVFLSVSSPVFIKGDIKGYVSAGMTGKSLTEDLKNINNLIAFIFIFIWLFFASVLIIYMLFVSKKLKNRYRRVKQSALERAAGLELERNRLQAVLMSIINGVIVCDIDDNVILANSAALKMLDINEKDEKETAAFLNTRIQNFTDSHGAKCFFEKIEEFKNTPLNIREQKPVEFNIEAGKSAIKAAISPMFINRRDYAGYVIVLIDITREEEVNKLKNTFISNVSHELRTPVTVLRTYIDTLCNNSEDFDENTKKEFLQTIDKEAARLHSMVNEILDFSRLESDNIVLRKEYTNLSELLKQNINSIKILAEEKNINIKFIQKEEMPDIPVNIESMDRAARNLLSNAVKYSHEGGEIIVTAGMTEDKKQAVFSVKDNGIGIAKEHLDKIFDRFYRVENMAHTIKGTGLGLHLVKITVEKRHNGRITVSSKENEGSIFTVYLPVSADESELA